MKTRSVVMLVSLLLICSCQGVENTMESVPYSQLYDRLLSNKVEVNVSDHTKASYGYTENHLQGHQNWYYGQFVNNQFVELNYSQADKMFKGNDAYIKGPLLQGYQVARKYLVPVGGRVTVTGKLEVKESNTRFEIRKDSLVLKVLEHLPTDEMGVYIESEFDVETGDVIYFIINGKADWNPSISFQTVKSSSLHYQSGIDTDYAIVGDVHPYYENGKMKNYYLSTNGRFTADMTEAEDMVIFNDTNTTTSSTNPPLSEGFATRVVKVDNTYYSFYGAYDRFEATKSSDAYIFENSVTLDENLRVLYQAKIDENYIWARDPYAFYDDDIGKWRIVSLNYRSVDNGKMPNIDLALYTATGNGIETFSRTALPLIPFGETKNEPEVPQMMKIKNRWYLFASLSGRSIHNVGPISYWIGDENKPIDQVNWGLKQELVLTGEDLCAAQIVEVNDRYYLYGWIPRDFNGGTWGGSINLPQEVYVKPNGELGVRLDSYLTKKLSKGLMFDLYGNVVINQGLIEKVEKGYRVNKLDEGRAQLQIPSASLKRNLITMQSTVTSDGLVGVSLTQGNEVIEIRYNSDNQLITVGKKGVALNYAKLQTNVTLSNVEMKIVVEDNILEIFINDTYALCARIDVTFDKYLVGYYTNSVGSIISKLNIYQLASRENFQDN